jgi:hypothetical protein
MFMRMQASMRQQPVVAIRLLFSSEISTHPLLEAVEYEDSFGGNTVAELHPRRGYLVGDRLAMTRHEAASSDTGTKSEREAEDKVTHQMAGRIRQMVQEARLLWRLCRIRCG